MANGREILLDVLGTEGVRHIFGNPGTTELPFMDELAAHPEFDYILALQENTAVGMADGYAQATGRPAFLNLHTSAGLGGGLGNLTNALANRTPLVVTAGQQDRRHLIADPLLGGDLTGLASSVSKWQHEVRHVDELAVTLRRAFKDAETPPTGPVFVSIPMDVLDESTEAPVPAKSQITRDAVAGGLEQAADLLCEPGPDDVALVVGDGVAQADAIDEVTALAEALGCTAHGSPLYSNLNFPTDHPLWAGSLAPFAALVHGSLDAYRRVLVIGAQAILVYPYTPGPAIPESVELLHLDADPVEIGRTYSTRLGMQGGIKASVARLTELVRQRADEGAARARLDRKREESRAAAAGFAEVAAERFDQVPMHPMAAAHALVDALPEGATVVDEAITTGIYVRGFHRTATPGAYYFCRGGGLGWGMPAALGVQLACPDAPVLCVVGDGSAMYSIQSLWTAAAQGYPVVFAVVNNRQYKILRDNLAASGGHSAKSETFVGMDLADPPIDYVALARSMGVEAMLVEKAHDVGDAVATAFDADGPFLLELPIGTG